MTQPMTPRMEGFDFFRKMVQRGSGDRPQGGYLVPPEFVVGYKKPEPKPPNPDCIEMVGVREHGEGDGVELHLVGNEGPSQLGPLPFDGKRLVVRAYDECGYASTNVDLLDLIAWLKEHRPELLK